MVAPRRSYRFLVSCLTWLPVLAAGTLLMPAASVAQGPNAPAAAATTSTASSMSVDERETFLAKAKIVNVRSAGKGVTNTKRATLSDGAVTHDASIQTIDEAKARFDSNLGTELNFKDSWRFNIAAYRIDRLLEINMIPATVERRHDGKPGSFTWWVDDVLMDEQERYRQKKTVPDTDDWNQQMWITRLFDQLIANVDRNLGNLLIDKAYNIWMIDHSRAFRINKDLRAAGNLSKVDRGLLDRLRKVDKAGIKGAVGNYLSDGEIDALLARRDRIVAHYDASGPELLFDRRPR
jgi:hypothetical protein